MAGEVKCMVLRDYAMPQALGMTSSIINSEIKAHNFELNLALVAFIMRDQFSGHPFDKPNVHLRKFLVKCDIINIMGHLPMRFE